MKIKPTSKHGVVVELGPNEAQLPGNDSSGAFNLKRVLVPVDFSDCSKKALAYALPFARQFGAEIVLTYVLEPYAPVPELTTVDWDLILARMRESGATALHKLRDSLGEEGVKIKTELRIGQPAREIISAADEFDADVIILSTHGHTGLKRMFLGSVAEHVTRHARCPVLIVREREHDFVDIPATKPSYGKKRNRNLRLSKAR